MTRLIGLNFHGIGEPTRTLEPNEAPYWLTIAQFANILDRVAASPNPHSYILTFDDGNLSDYDIALPALTSRGLSGVVFVLTGRIGQLGSLNADQIRALAKAGVTIGSHGITHRPWSELEGVALDTELAGSRRWLEEICGHPVKLAGIPFGRYDARILRGLRRAGYQGAYSSDGGTMSRNAYLRPRTSLRTDMTPTDIDALLAGRLPPIRRLRRALGMVHRRILPLG